VSDQEAPNSEDLAAKTLGRVRKAELSHEKIKARLKRFQLFEDHEYTDYKGDKRKVPKAQRQAHDNPILQMMIARRDRYEACLRHIARLEKELELLSGREATDALCELSRLESIADRHARGIETALASFAKTDMSVQSQRSHLLTSVAQLAQRERHHSDKMDLHRKQNPGDLPDAELLRIANGEEIIEPDADA
jgi:hypothetical protein